MWRNLVLLFVKIISFHNPINLFAILYPTSLPNLVVEVGTRHGHQFLLGVTLRPQRSARFFLVGVAMEKPSICIMMFKCDSQVVVITSYILKQHKSILFLQDLSIDKYDMFRLVAIILS